MARRVWIKRAVKWLVAIIALLILLIAVAIVFKNPLLKTVTCWNLKSATGMMTMLFGHRQRAVPRVHPTPKPVATRLRIVASFSPS